MVAKKGLIFIIIMLLLLTTSSCTGQNTETEQPLSIYCMDYDLYIKDAVASFNAGQGKSVLEAKTFFMDQAQDYADQLKAELASGGGPDIIVIQNSMISDFSKYIKTGYFYDLNELMENDPDYITEDYYESVLNTGLVNNGRYFLPYSFIMNAYYTTGEILERYSTDPDTPFLSMNDLSMLARDFAAMNQEDGKYLIDEFDIYSSDIIGLTDLLYRQTSLDTARITGLMNEYKTIREVMSPFAQIGSDSSRRLKDEEVSFLGFPIYGFFNISEPYTAFQSQVVPEICSITFNSEDEVMAQPMGIVAINANCSDKETAYKFIKSLVSEGTQSHEFMTGLPVNRAAYAAQKEKYLKDSQSSGGMGLQHAEKMVKELDGLLAGTITCTMMDMEAMNTLQGEFSSFLEGDQTAEELVAAMEQKLAEYRDKPIDIPEAALAQIGEANENLPVLTVWYMEYDWSVKNAIRSFKKTRPDIRIESKECPNTSYEDGVMKMTTEIMVGEGPDIICFRPSMFNSLHKTMESGAFCDLNPLIASDATFSNLDLNQSVLDNGVYHGKRYFIPIRYSMPFLVSTKGVLDGSGVTIGEDWTLDDLKNTLLDYASRSGNRCFFSSQMGFSYLLEYCGKSFIDYEASQCTFQSEEFIGLMELYKEIYPYIMPYDEATSMELPPVSMQNNRFVMDVNALFSPEQLNTYNAIYHGVLGEDMVIYAFPTMNGRAEKPVTITDAVAISADCENKQAALDFAEELLSINSQAAMDENQNSNITMGLPVNREALSQDMNDLVNMDTTGMIVGSGTQTFTPLPLPEALASRMVGLVDKASGVSVIDTAAKQIINEGVQSYLDGKRNAQQAAKDIDDKVRLFLNE